MAADVQQVLEEFRMTPGHRRFALFFPTKHVSELNRQEIVARSVLRDITALGAKFRISSGILPPERCRSRPIVVAYISYAGQQEDDVVRSHLCLAVEQFAARLTLSDDESVGILEVVDDVLRSEPNTDTLMRM